MELITAWSDVGSPGTPYPIITRTEFKLKKVSLTGDRPLIKKEARLLAEWWYNNTTCHSVEVVKNGKFYDVNMYVKEWF
jgi:endonuclease YncB( thermonuclease family)